MKEKYNNGEKAKIGNVYINKRGCVFEVIKWVGKDYSGEKFIVRFRETGYETSTYGKSIKIGYVRDPYHKSTCGVGYIGELEKYDKRIMNIWNGMIEKCYSKRNKEYMLYGKPDIIVDPRWHCFANFLNDFTKIDGYNDELFNKGLLRFDKDKKQIGVENKIYSLETCTFIDNPKKPKYDSENSTSYMIDKSKKKQPKSVDIVGQEFTNIKGYKFKVIKHISDDYSGRKFLVRFNDTGTEVEAYSKCIVKGEVRDSYHPSVYGIGYMGAVTGSTTKEYYVWRNMMSRCYDTNSKYYKYYGGKGVSVDSRWHSYENFLKDLTKIDGYDKELIDKGLLELDKDKKQMGISNKIYSLNTCSFISGSENMYYRFYNKGPNPSDPNFTNVNMRYNPKEGRFMYYAMRRLPELDTQMKKAMTRV